MNPLGLQAWFEAYVFTQVVEVPLYLWLTRISGPRAFLASTLTHPVVWFGFFHPALPWGYQTKLIGAELFAWLAEAVYLRYACRIPLGKALWVSLLANGASLGLGSLSRTLFNWP